MPRVFAVLGAVFVFVFLTIAGDLVLRAFNLTTKSAVERLQDWREARRLTDDRIILATEVLGVHAEVVEAARRAEKANKEAASVAALFAAAKARLGAAEQSYEASVARERAYRVCAARPPSEARASAQIESELAQANRLIASAKGVEACGSTEESPRTMRDQRQGGRVYRDLTTGSGFLDSTILDRALCDQHRLELHADALIERSEPLLSPDAILSREQARASSL